MAVLNEKPDRPGNDECCGGGSCCPSVWDFYYEKLAQWEEQQQKPEKPESREKS